MHPQAYEWVQKYTNDKELSVLDLGGRDVNGSTRSLWPSATKYTVVDILPGEGVDYVADAATWDPDDEYDVVVTTETFEHTAVWREICATAYKACKDDGVFIATMAGPGRQPHSAYDGGPLRSDEYYGNINPDRIRKTLEDLGFNDIVVDQQFNPCDVRVFARKS